MYIYIYIYGICAPLGLRPPSDRRATRKPCKEGSGLAALRVVQAEFLGADRSGKHMDACQDGDCLQAGQSHIAGPRCKPGSCLKAGRELKDSCGSFEHPWS